MTALTTALTTPPSTATSPASSSSDASPPSSLAVPRARRLASEAEAIEAARHAADAIAEISADPAQNDRLPLRQAEILSQSGVTAISLPKELGGLGASVKTVVETVRLISVADGGVGQLLQIHNVMIRGVGVGFAPEIRDRLVADILDGKRFGNALAEVGGKNKFDHKTFAERQPDGRLILRGSKFYSTGSYLAEWISLSAGSTEGPINVLLHRDTPGLELLDDWHAFGQQHSVSGTARFNDVVVDERFVPRRPQGPGGMPRTGLTWPQILHAAIDTGIARGALDAAVHHLRHNTRPWVDAEVDAAAQEPHIIKTIGEYAVAVRAAEALLRHAAALFDEHRADPDSKPLQDELILAVASARAASDDASLRISSDMFSLLGANSSLTKWNLDRFWRNARVHTTHDPIRWRLHHVGNYYLNGVDPAEYGAALRERRANAGASSH